MTREQMIDRAVVRAAKARTWFKGDRDHIRTLLLWLKFLSMSRGDEWAAATISLVAAEFRQVECMARLFGL